MKKPSTPIHYPLISISDLHLGKRLMLAAEVLEFLENTSCDTLILNGDIIDGWVLQDNKHRKWKELQLRILDALNKKAANGTNIIYIAGNHDESLRKSWNTMQRRIKKPKDKPYRHKIINRDYTFSSHQDRSLSSTIKIRNGYRHTDPKGQNILFVHGDQFDHAMQTPWLKNIGEALDPGYDACVHIDRIFNTSIATWVKKTAKTIAGTKFQESAMIKGSKGRLDAIACGHSHDAKIQRSSGALSQIFNFYNSGDWVESATALAHDKDGNWELINWKEKREDLGLTELPSTESPNPNIEYRPITQRQAKWAQRIWPAKNLHKKMSKIQNLHKKITDLEQQENQEHALLKTQAQLKKKQDEVRPY